MLNRKLSSFIAPRPPHGFVGVRTHLVGQIGSVPVFTFAFRILLGTGSMSGVAGMSRVRIENSIQSIGFSVGKDGK